MKKNQNYILVISLLFICESLAHILKFDSRSEVISVFCAFFSFLITSIWYYQMQKHQLLEIQKLFLISILLPIFNPILWLFLTKPQTLIIVILSNILFFGLWIYIFRRMGAKIVIGTYKKRTENLIPFIVIIPILFFCVVLLPQVPHLYLLPVAILIIAYSYGSILSNFLPINDESKNRIVLGIVIYIFETILYGYHYFLQELPFGVLSTRALIVISRCMIIYGMINYRNTERIGAINEN